jgi:hypothetical protein
MVLASLFYISIIRDGTTSIILHLPDQKWGHEKQTHAYS